MKIKHTLSVITSVALVAMLGGCGGASSAAADGGGSSTTGTGAAGGSTGGTNGASNVGSGSIGTAGGSSGGASSSAANDLKTSDAFEVSVNGKSYEVCLLTGSAAKKISQTITNLNAGSGDMSYVSSLAHNIAGTTVTDLGEALMLYVVEPAK